MAGDRHGSAAASHRGLGRDHGDPRRPCFHRLLGWMSAYTANHPSRDDDIRAPNNILKS